MNRDLESAIATLRSPQQNFVAIREALKKLLVLDNQGKDIGSATNYVVKILPLHDHVIKKLACNLIARLSDRVAGTGLLVQNTLGNDLRDPNPQVRALAVRTLCDCSHDTDDAIRTVTAALDDPSPYVRRAAVLSCVRLARRTSGSSVDTLVNSLYATLRDVDPLVVGNALAALDEVLRDEGGAVINRNIARHLASRLATLDDWSVSHALTALLRHTPADQGQLFQLLDAADPFLRHTNLTVSVCAIRLFLHLLSTSTPASGSTVSDSATRDLRPDVYQRALPRLASAMSDAAHPEQVRLVLHFVQERLDDDNHGRSPPVPASVFVSLSNSLLCKYGEPDDIKVKKIDLLARVVVPESSRLLDEIAMYCTSSTPAVSCSAIRAVAQVAQRSNPDQTTVFESCMTRLLALLELDRVEVTERVLGVLCTLDLSRTLHRAGLFSALGRCSGRLTASDGAAEPLVWLLGEWGGEVQEAPYVLERLSEELSGCTGQRAKLSLVRSALKLFFVRPGEMQPVLGRLLERCWKDEDAEVSRGALYYYRLLSLDVDLARKIVVADEKPQVEPVIELLGQVDFGV